MKRKKIDPKIVRLKRDENMHLAMLRSLNNRLAQVCERAKKLFDWQVSASQVLARAAPAPGDVELVLQLRQLALDSLAEHQAGGDMVAEVILSAPTRPYALGPTIMGVPYKVSFPDPTARASKPSRRKRK